MKPFYTDLEESVFHKNLYPKTKRDAYSSFSDRIKSFKYAWEGIIYFFRNEYNAKFHLVAAIVVTGVSFYFRISRMEATAIIFSISMVWITEMINTAFEKSMDMISPLWDQRVKFIKDVAAGAVLVASIAAAVTSTIIFIPKIIQ